MRYQAKFVPFFAACVLILVSTGCTKAKMHTSRVVADRDTTGRAEPELLGGPDSRDRDDRTPPPPRELHESVDERNPRTRDVRRRDVIVDRTYGEYRGLVVDGETGPPREVRVSDSGVRYNPGATVRIEGAVELHDRNRVIGTYERVVGHNGPCVNCPPLPPPPPPREPETKTCPTATGNIPFPANLPCPCDDVTSPDLRCLKSCLGYGGVEVERIPFTNQCLCDREPGSPRCNPPRVVDTPAFCPGSDTVRGPNCPVQCSKGDGTSFSVISPQTCPDCSNTGRENRDQRCAPLPGQKILEVVMVVDDDLLADKGLGLNEEPLTSFSRPSYFANLLVGTTYRQRAYTDLELSRSRISYVLGLKPNATAGANPSFSPNRSENVHPIKAFVGKLIDKNISQVDRIVFTIVPDYCTGSSACTSPPSPLSFSIDLGGRAPTVDQVLGQIRDQVYQFSREAVALATGSSGTINLTPFQQSSKAFHGYETLYNILSSDPWSMKIVRPGDKKKLAILLLTGATMNYGEGLADSTALLNWNNLQTVPTPIAITREFADSCHFDTRSANADANCPSKTELLTALDSFKRSINQADTNAISLVVTRPWDKKETTHSSSHPQMLTCAHKDQYYELFSEGRGYYVFNSAQSWNLFASGGVQDSDLKFVETDLEGPWPTMAFDFTGRATMPAQDSYVLSDFLLPGQLPFNVALDRDYRYSSPSGRTNGTFICGVSPNVRERLESSRAMPNVGISDLLLPMIRSWPQP